MMIASWPASAREATAMLYQARYLGKDLAEVHHIGTGPHVVLLHGLYATAGVFAPLRARLHLELAASTHSFSYVPGPGVEALTRRLAELLGRIDGQGPIHLVGHSLGGLVMRNYVLSEDRDPRVVQTISLASPYLGSRRSWLVPGRAGADITAQSELLRRLRSRDVPGIRHLSILAGQDAMVIPGGIPSFGEVVTMPAVGHNGVLFHPQVHEQVVERIRTR